MRLASITAFVLAGLIVAPVRGAAFSIISGTLHAEASARTTSASTPVTSTPADVTLGVATLSGSVSASIHSDPGQADDMIGSSSTSGGLTSRLVSANFSSGGNDNIGVGGFASGSGSIDLIFGLNSPAQVQFISSISGSPSSINIVDTLKLLDSTSATIHTFGLGDSLSTANLAAGNYELTGSITGQAAVGSQGGATAQLSIGIVPEPIGVACVAIASLALIRRRSIN